MKRVLLSVLPPLVFLFACQSQTPPAVVPTKTVDPASVGTIRGVVRFEGVAPAPTKIPVAGFPECANPATEDRDVLIHDGLVQNAFVYVKSGLEDYAFPPAPNETAEIVLDQKGCLYEPRVVGLRAGQTLVVKNSDAMLHNVHAQPKKSRSFNVAMVQGAADIRKTFSEPEVMVGLRCDVHPWMRAYAGVLPHPYFAVTGPDGTFSLPGLPAGTYVIGVWHERMAPQDATVTLGVGAENEIRFVVTPGK